MIELVIFDLAGTTVEDPDGVGGALKGALLADGPRPTNEAVNAIMGIPKPVAISQLITEIEGVPPSPERIDSIFRDFQRRMVAYYAEDPAVREIHGATEVFRELRRRGIKVGLDTGFDRSIVDTILKRLGWGGDLIDASAASDEVPRGRPFPDLVFHLMELVGVGDPQRVAKVGDTPSDLQEGTAAGCAMVVGVTEGTHSLELLQVHPHTHLIPNITHLPALL